MHLPDRKVWAQGTSGVLAWVILTAITPVAARYGIPIPPGANELLSFLISTGVGYLVPAAEQDVIRHLDERVIAMAQADPTIPSVLKKKA